MLAPIFLRKKNVLGLKEHFFYQHGTDYLTANFYSSSQLGFRTFCSHFVGTNNNYSYNCQNF